MSGTVSKPTFHKDGQYLSLTADADITLGNLVKLTSTGTDTCDVAGAGNDAIGVATNGDRFSRTQTDNVVPAGQKVTVATRGVCYVYTDTSAILVGSYVKPGTGGVVTLGASGDLATAFGIALDANGSAAATIRVKVLRG